MAERKAAPLALASLILLLYARGVKDGEDEGEDVAEEACERVGEDCTDE